MPKVTLVFSYHGYPMSRAKRVVQENITGDDEWQEYLTGILEGYGLQASRVVIGKPYAPAKREDFVAVRVPVEVEYTDTRSGEPLTNRLHRFCDNAVDYEEGFYCDSCFYTLKKENK